MENEGKERFSYTSPELQRKNALKVLGIEAIIIIIVVVLIFFALSYFGIFRIADLVKEFEPNASVTPTQKSAVSQAAISPVIDKNAKPSVEAVSDIPNYTLTLQNEDKLLDLLNSWGTFNKEYQTRYGAEGTTLGTPLKKIIVHLTDKLQQSNYFGSDPKKPLSSTDTKIVPGKFDVYVYLSPNVLNGTSKENPPSQLFQTNFLVSLYKIVKVGSTPQESQKITQDVYSSFQTDPLMKMEYFKIEKK